MLVDRILVEGVPRSMTHGRVVTEHDVTAERWYLIDLTYGYLIDGKMRQ